MIIETKRRHKDCFLSKNDLLFIPKESTKSQNFINAGTAEAFCDYCFQKHTCKNKLTNKCRNVYQEDDKSISKINSDV